jgi:hypothetical protein
MPVNVCVENISHSKICQQHTSNYATPIVGVSIITKPTKIRWAETHKGMMFHLDIHAPHLDRCHRFAIIEEQRLSGQFGGCFARPLYARFVSLYLQAALERTRIGKHVGFLVTLLVPVVLLGTAGCFSFCIWCSWEQSACVPEAREDFRATATSLSLAAFFLWIMVLQPLQIVISQVVAPSFVESYICKCTKTSGKGAQGDNAMQAFVRAVAVSAVMMIHVEALVSSLEESTHDDTDDDSTRPVSAEPTLFLGRKRRQSMSGGLPCFDEIDAVDNEEGDWDFKEKEIQVVQIACKWKCGSSFTSSGICTQHEKSCPKREIQCQNTGCPRHVLLESYIAHQLKCDWLVRECEFCGEKMTSKALRRHIRDKHTKVNCTNNCGKEVIEEALSMHLKHDCPKRTASCELCQKSMTFGKLQFHKVCTVIFLLTEYFVLKYSYLLNVPHSNIPCSDIPTVEHFVLKYSY